MRQTEIYSIYLCIYRQYFYLSKKLFPCLHIFSPSHLGTCLTGTSSRSVRVRKSELKQCSWRIQANRNAAGSRIRANSSTVSYRSKPRSRRLKQSDRCNDMIQNSPSTMLSLKKESQTQASICRHTETHPSSDMPMICLNSPDTLLNWYMQMAINTTME